MKIITILLIMNTSLSYSQIVMHNDTNNYQTEDFGFSQAVSSNGIVYLSGMVGWDNNYNLTGRGVFEDQLKQTISNIASLLEQSKSNLEHIISLRIYVVNLDGAKRKIIGTYLKQTFPNQFKPCNTLIGITNLARPELLIEIEVTAKQLNP